MNAVVSTGLYKDPNGYRELHLDNCYSVVEIFKLLKASNKILAYGIICTNREGWYEFYKNLSKTSKRGKSKIQLDKINGIFLCSGMITRLCCSYHYCHWVETCQCGKDEVDL